MRHCCGPYGKTYGSNHRYVLRRNWIAQKPMARVQSVKTYQQGRTVYEKS